MENEEVGLNKTELREDDVIYGIKEPARSCKHCYGTGKSAWNEKGDPILCRCLKRDGGGDWITMANFRAICNNKRNQDEGSNNNTGINEVHTSEDDESVTET